MTAVMNAVEITAPGGPAVLRMVERPHPSPAAGEVLIKVAAAGVNRPDIMQREGRYPPPPGASDIPGLEIAGTVIAVGKGVDVGMVGAEVCALVTGGGYAELCTAAAALCLPWPDGYDAARAAALPETFFTVWTNVFQRANLRRGETLLVHGGASGIGTTAIQLARAFGATVFTTAGSDAKCEACTGLGAARAINYKSEDFAAAVHDATGGDGVNVILDMVGGDYLQRNINCLAAGGRLVQIALQRGAKGELDLSAVMLGRLTITGATLRARSVTEKTAIADALRAHVWPLLNDKTVAPVMHKTFPLPEAAAAHAELDSGVHIGKVVLAVD